MNQDQIQVFHQIMNPIYDAIENGILGHSLNAESSKRLDAILGDLKKLAEDTVKELY